MRIVGEQTIAFPVEQVWGALLDPAVLVRTLPGCERLETTGDQAYAMTVAAGVAAIRGTYDGTCVLSDLVPHESLVMRLQGAGAPGTIDATVDVRFAPTGDGGTRVSYDADAVVGGMVGGVGQRVLAGVAKKTAGLFFAAIDDVLIGAKVVAPAPAAVVPIPAGGGPAPLPVPAVRPGWPSLIGAAAFGAISMLIGVLVGARIARKR